MSLLPALALRLLLAVCLVVGPLGSTRAAIASDLAASQDSPCAHMHGMGDAGGEHRPCCPDMPECPDAHCAPATCAPSALAWLPVTPVAWSLAWPSESAAPPPLMSIAAAAIEPPIRPPIA